MWHLCAYVLGVMDPGSGHLVTTSTGKRFYMYIGLGVIACRCHYKWEFEHYNSGCVRSGGGSLGVSLEGLANCRYWGACGKHGSISTSRKHGKKEPQSFSHCGSFDHYFGGGIGFFSIFQF